MLVRFLIHSRQDPFAPRPARTDSRLRRRRSGIKLKRGHARHVRLNSRQALHLHIRSHSAYPHSDSRARAVHGCLSRARARSCPGARGKFHRRCSPGFLSGLRQGAGGPWRATHCMPGRRRSETLGALFMEW
eukprot:7482532-Pyramimonas_sp.AAC.1